MQRPDFTRGRSNDLVPDDGNDESERLYCVKSIETQTVFVPRRHVLRRNEHVPTQRNE
jgi:hypothetical protein